MDKLIIKATPKSLSVKFAPGELNLSGNSILSDPKIFFEPVLNWCKEYVDAPNEATTVNFKLEYVDTASVQLLIDILAVLGKLDHQVHTLNINWYYEPDDPELLELGEIMAGRLGLEFNFIQY